MNETAGMGHQKMQQQQALQHNQNGSSYKTTQSQESTRLLLEEQSSAQRSERMVDQQMDLMRTVRQTMHSQKKQLKLARNRLLVSLSQRLPGVDKLVRGINWRRRRDAIILACVVGTCLCFLIMYLLR